MKKLFWSFFCLVTLFSCKSVNLQPLRTQTTTTQKDSVATRTQVKDTLLVVKPKEVADLSAVIDQLSQMPITQTNGGATVSLSRQGNQIQASCECEEYKKAIKIYQEIIERFVNTETKTLEETTVVQNKIPGWAKPFLYLGITFVAGVFILAFLYIKRLPKSVIN